MTDEEFETVAQRAVEYWGEKAVSAVVVQRLAAVVMPLPVSTVLKCLDKLGTEYAFRMPNLALIKERLAEPLAKQRKADLSKRLEEIEKHGGCVVCGLEGVFRVTDKSPHAYEYSFRCPYCRAAEVRGLGPDYKPWRSELEETFTPPPGKTLPDTRRMLRVVPEGEP